MLNIQELNTFLIEAKKQTYANENMKKVDSLRPSSHDYHYESEKGIYHDTYFGGKKFMGEEVVYFGEGNPKWGMNYYGFTINEKFTEEMIDKVLRPALIQVGEDTEIIPVRGPREYKNGEWKYTFSVKGNLENFTGLEEISRNDEVIYRLYCHGGIIE